jgi:ribosomal protein L37AE/L43A
MSREAWTDRDPYDIVPEAFKARYDSIREAELEKTTTDTDELPRCPDCKSTNIRGKRSGMVEMPHERPEDHTCNHCGLHFDDPAPPRAERIGRQATLQEVDG